MKNVKNIMKIEKFKKLKGNEYEVIIDSKSVILYDDIIVKYNLISKKNISPSELTKIIKENDDLKSYYLSIKYITKKLRSEKEIEDYLKKKEFSEDIIKNTIIKLKENNFLNKKTYIKSYINDQINLTLNGPKKIINNLICLGFDEGEILEYLNNIDKEIFNEKIKKIIGKKIKTNHNYSTFILKQKITNYLINLGYEKKDIDKYINQFEFSSNNVISKKANILLRKIEKKETDINKVKNILKSKLYSQGFSLDEINEYLKKL